MLRTFQNIARSEILENDDRHSVSRRSTRSMFEGSEYDRYGRGKRPNGRPFQFAAGDDAINAKVRKAIENSFIKQMEENAAMESDTKGSVKDDRNNKSEDESAKTERSSSNTDKSETSRSQQSQSNAAPKRSRKSKAPCVPPSKKKELPDMINELPGAKNTAKRIMDAVIREMVDVKALDHHHARSSDRTTAIGDYEVDSLERSKCSRKSSTSPDQSSTDQSSPALSTALPMDEELTMQNAVINTRTGEMTMSKLSNQILADRNCYNSLPELISSQRSETYSLVSEVYVNDGYASPACSDDSGPEIQYEPENPGHLTIKVQDSPDNYVKLDESEYEPDTLDRKPMKLRINDDMQYDRREIANEIYVDSLERPAQILLRSRGSFRDEDNTLQHGHGSLREIYEARIKSSLKDPHLTNGHDVECQMNGESDGTHSWKKCRYLTPDSRQAKRQRQPHNQPDVVPLPPTEEEIYQRPKPPRRVEDARLPPLSLSKNAWDGSPVEAGDPTASNGAPVPKADGYHVGDQTCICASQTQVDVATKYDVYNEEHREDIVPLTGATFFNERIDECTVTNGCKDCPCETRIEIEDPEDRFYEHVGSSKEEVSRGTKMREKRSVTGSSHHRSSARSSRTRSWSVDHHREDEDKLLNSKAQSCCSKTRQLKGLSKGLSKSCDSSSSVPLVDNRRGHVKVEDSGYLSSTDSNGSHKRLLGHEVSSVSEETDETESVCDGASESGAESVGTDSVFFGNFRRLSEISKSADSGVDLGARNPSYYQPLFGTRNETAIALERVNFSTSDSETESLVTVLPPCSGQCNKLVS